MKLFLGLPVCGSITGFILLTNVGYCLQLKSVHVPGEVEQTSGSLMAHEVVSQVQVGDILTVKKTLRHLLQAVTGQVNHADCLRNHLHKHTRHQK